MAFSLPHAFADNAALDATAAAAFAAALLGLVVWRAVRRARALSAAARPPSRALPTTGRRTPLDAALDALFRAHARHGSPDSAARLLASGHDAFAARALSAAAAGRSLDLMYYSWRGDTLGRLLAAELWNAAERGARVRLLVDDVNAEGADAALAALDRHANIEVRVHNPLWIRSGAARVAEMLLRFARINHRMHNKAWIADGRLAIVGGRNIEDRYFDAAEEVNFRDLDMLVLGPAVGEAERVFDLYWNHETAWPVAALSQDDDAAIEAARARILAAKDEPAAQAYARAVAATPDLAALLATLTPLRWSSRIEIASDPPAKWRARRARRDWIVTRLWTWMRATRGEALIVSPYFVPRRRFTALLRQLARGGARVEVVTNSLAANDVAAVHGGYMRYRRKLLRGKVALYEVRHAVEGEAARSVFGSSNASLHTKAALFDGAKGFVGSFNMDPRSARVNSEMGVFFEDEALAADLRAEIERLKSPELSYRVKLDGLRLYWIDAATTPTTTLDEEPHSTFAQRMIARLAGWLPIEQEL